MAMLDEQTHAIDSLTRVLEIVDIRLLVCKNVDIRVA
jgi:hypothetical protein